MCRNISADQSVFIHLHVDERICMCNCSQCAVAPLGLFKELWLTVLSPHHDVAVNEALAVAGRLEMGILFSAGDPNVPHTSPSLVKLQVYGVDTWVVRSHGVTHVHWNVVLLERDTYARVIYINTKGYSTFTTLTKDMVAHKDEAQQSDLVEEAHGLWCVCYDAGLQVGN